MKYVLLILMITILVSYTVCLEAKPLEEYIQQAEGHQQSGYLAEAVSTMEAAVQEHPHSPEAHSYLGLYLGTRAGQTNDMVEAMELVNRSFQMLDKAVSMNPEHPLVRFHRGLMALNVPDFFGKLDQGIEDLEFATVAFERAPDQVPREQLFTANELLATGYERRGDLDLAKSVWERMIQLDPGSEMAKQAEEKINALAQKKKQQLQAQQKQPDSARIEELKGKLEKDPENVSLHIELGSAYLDEKNHDQAEKVLKEAIARDPNNVELYKLLAEVLTEKVSVGYDERIHDNTDLRTNLAFEVMTILDKAVPLDPENFELRLWRGIMGIQMPFFVQKLDQGIEDLNFIIEGDAPDELTAQALYWRGMGYRKKMNTSWIEVVTEYSDSPAARMVFDSMTPEIQRLDPSQQKTPLVTIDLVLGFQDELAPQTAIWIEDQGGHFVRTLYVSGFAGYVKERQITLPLWADASSFIDADAVTGASIDIGHHIFVWDLKDHAGTKVKPAEYTVKVEVSHWPSMQYQLAEATIELGKTEQRTVVEEGNFIPYLEVRYVLSKRE